MHRFAPLILITTLAWFSPIATANLVKNGDFADAAGGKPAGWSVVESPQTVSVEKVDDKNCLKVEIVKENGKSLGEIRQTVKIKPKTKYRFSGEVKSSKGGGALFMLKPRVNKKEAERINAGSSKAEWTTVTKEFDSGDADEVQILCRFSQKADQVGVTHWFTNIKLEALDADGKPVEEKAAAPAAGGKPQAKAAAGKSPAAARVAGDGTDQYVTVDGAGDKSGKDFDNARDAAGLQDAIDAAGPGNTVWVGSGNYPAKALNFGSGGGKEGAVKTLAGKDTGSGLPLFKGTWTKDNPAKSGGIFLAIPAGVSHLTVRDLKVENVRCAVQFRGRNSHISIENVDVTEGRDVFWVEGAATADDEASYSHHISFKDCDIKYYTKRAMRIFNGVREVQVTNCHADAGGKDWAVEVFPLGFQVIGGDNGVIDSDITYTDCTASGNYHDGGREKYWNADGFCTERAVRNVTYIRCAAFDNTDGGWDVKNAGLKLVDCIAVGNKRNFRVWLNEGAPAVLENCLSAYSVDRGDRGHDVGFWFLWGGEASMTRCTAWGDRLSMKIESKDGAEPKPTQMSLDHCVLAPKDGGKDRTLAPKTDLKDNGTVTVAELSAPREGWRGGDEAFNVKGNAEIGYRFRK